MQFTLGLEISSLSSFALCLALPDRYPSFLPVKFPGKRLNPLLSRNNFALSNLFGAINVPGEEGEKNAMLSPFLSGLNSIFIPFL